MAREASPAARALLALEAIQNTPGISAQRLGERLGVTERAARRYVAILREAELPIESISGPHGGYRVGRGLRLAPLMFTAAEAMGLIMAVLEGHRDAADPSELVGGALAKILRVLPERVAAPVRAVRETSAPAASLAARPDPELTTRLIEYCSAARRLRIVYRTRTERVMEVDPWAVVLRHSRWYLLAWSHTVHAQRAYRVDRIVSIDRLPETFTPPQQLDALRTLEEHLSQGWKYPVDVLIDAPISTAEHWVRRSLGRLEPVGENQTLLRASTDEPDWYARQLATIELPIHILGSPELRNAMIEVSRQLVQAAGSEPNAEVEAAQ